MATLKQSKLIGIRKSHAGSRTRRSAWPYGHQIWSRSPRGCKFTSRMSRKPNEIEPRSYARESRVESRDEEGDDFRFGAKPLIVPGLAVRRLNTDERCTWPVPRRDSISVATTIYENHRTVRSCPESLKCSIRCKFDSCYIPRY